MSWFEAVFVIVLLVVVVMFVWFVKRYILLVGKYKLLFNRLFLWKYAFLFISLLIIILSFLGLTQKEEIQSGENKGVDIVFVLDVSKSMNAVDFEYKNKLYSRLSATKSLIKTFVSSHPGDRFGLVIFAGDANSVCPLTIDHDIFLTFLENVDYHNLNKQGTDLVDALRLGVDRFKDDGRSRVLILLSDGGDDNSIDYNLLDNIWEDKGINLFVVGIGTYKGAKIPLGRDVFGDIEYQRYKGKLVLTKLNDDILKDIAKHLGGKYYKADSFDALEKLNIEIDSLLKKGLKSYNTKDVQESYILPIFVSFVFFVVYLVLFFAERSFISKYKRGGKS